jgi:hypothetical protein
MNRLSISLLLVAGLIILCGTSFSKRSAFSTSTAFPKSSTASVTAPNASAKHRLKMETLLRPSQTLYYWYSYPYDTYNDRKTVNDEINEMWLYYAALVDTDPSGGELIEKGYYTGAYPHNQLPSYFLYVHWVY